MPARYHRFRPAAFALLSSLIWTQPASGQAWPEMPGDPAEQSSPVWPSITPGPPVIGIQTEPRPLPFVQPPPPPPPPIPRSVRAMLDAALATGDKAKVATVVELAKQTNPNHAEELNAIHRAFQDEKKKAAQLAAAREEQRLRDAGVFERWSGRGEIGAFQASGNSNNVGLSAALSLKRQGIDWSHQVRGKADYQRSNGVTSREQFLFAYEPRFQINDRMFSYALAQYERDRFQGFYGRYSISGGLGFHLIDTDRLDLTVQGGPAFRRVRFVEGSDSNNLAALATAEVNWRLTDRLTFTQNTNVVADAGGRATVIVDSRNTSFTLVSGLEAKVSDRLTTRLSHTLEYDSAPPEGSVSTDQLTRFTLVYGF